LNRTFNFWESKAFPEIKFFKCWLKLKPSFNLMGFSPFSQDILNSQKGWALAQPFWSYNLSSFRRIFLNILRNMNLLFEQSSNNSSSSGNKIFIFRINNFTIRPFKFIGRSNFSNFKGFPTKTQTKPATTVGMWMWSTTNHSLGTPKGSLEGGPLGPTDRSLIQSTFQWPLRGHGCGRKA
jgi:hypothetical protein